MSRNRGEARIVGSFITVNGNAVATVVQNTAFPTAVVDMVADYNRSKWIDVKNRLPEDGTEVLCWDGFNMCVGDCERYGNPVQGANWFWRGEGPDDNWQGPTHWMPLPEQPVKGG